MDSRDRCVSSSSVKTSSSGSRLRLSGRREQGGDEPMASFPHELAAKVGKPIRLLASNSQGEAFAALCAIARLLEAYGQSFHELAEHVENGGGGLSDDDKRKIRSEIRNAHAIGYAEG